MTENRFNIKNVSKNFLTISQITPGFITFILINTYNFVIKNEFINKTILFYMYVLYKRK
jgi:hypothetical protein